MKGLLTVLSLSISVLVMAGCGSDNGGGSSTKSEVMSVLKQGGYALEQRDSQAMAYYTDKMLNTKYGLNCTLNDLYVGYIDQARWMELLVFKSVGDADSYVAALKTENEAGKLVHQDGTSVVVTFSQETIDLFK
ncbi:MAG: hypothetical protein K9N55_14575 [Phycisphaerae bacterium]|nr:hypothetical protein [Phycisphaerae bacterium]